MSAQAELGRDTLKMYHAHPNPTEVDMRSLLNLIVAITLVSSVFSQTDILSLPSP